MKQILIVVPFRDRHEHLKDFLNHTPKYFIDKKIEYDILIAELDNVGDWNHGLCCNSLINFNVEEKYEYIYIHDVDVCPLNGDWKFPKEKEIYFNLGDHGSCVMKYESYLNSGGFSNNFWGWGYMDDCLYRRLILTGHEMVDCWGKILYDTKNQNHDREIHNINQSEKLKYLKKEYIDKNYFDIHIDGVHDTNKYGKTHSLIKIDDNIYKHNIYPLIKSPRELEINGN